VEARLASGWYVQSRRPWYEADRFSHWGEGKNEDFPEGDLEKILAADHFNFVMVGERKEYAGFTYVEVEKKVV
jgi:hypothetical protein